jgi:flagellar FliL protein
MAEQEKLDLGEDKPKSSIKGILFIVLGSVLGTLLAVFAALYFMGIIPPKDKAAAAGHAAAGHEQAGDEEQEGDAHGEEAKPIVYLPLKPAFAASFKNNPEARMVQIEITLGSTDEAILGAVEKHMPILRNNLLLILGGEDPSVLKTPEGKEALRAKIKDEIKKIVIEQTDKKVGVDEVFFTGFVMQ